MNFNLTSNKTVTGISYSGKVNVKIIKNQKVVKTFSIQNRGTSTLFKTMAMALCGFNVTPLIPQYLDFGYVNTDGFNTVLANRVSVSGRVVEDESVMINSANVTGQIGSLFNGYIASTNVVGSKVPSENDMEDKKMAFALYQTYLGDDSTQLAVLELTDDDETNLRDTILNSNHGDVFSILVEWLMIFTDAHTANSTSTTN